MPPHDETAPYRRTRPRIGECGLTVEDTGFDLWLSKQFEDGRPNMLLKFMSIHVWEREQLAEKGVICPMLKTRFLNEIGLSNIDLIDGLSRFGWVFLSHHGKRS